MLPSTTPERALEIGAGTGFLTTQLTRRFPATHWIVNDLAPAAQPYLLPHLQGVSHEFLWGDAEKAILPAELDLIATASTVQWFDDLPGFLEKCRQATRPGGYLALTTFGPDNFREIRALTGRGLPYPAIDQIAGYEIVAREEYREVLQFDSPREVLRHIRAIGVNALAPTAWSKGRLQEFEADYQLRFASRLTWHPLLVVAKKKK